ncbi:hypothetical protein PRK78_003594 [Emydomyces testavorans]|uniref:Uncharacterized protein n=1 Tax=Emydomyces testavorans TaxID=2070801 RepID=A0AAF0DGH4_9EURO|nr:hypothetical protein PRK78_003594 [Emydomyces testavorans]
MFGVPNAKRVCREDLEPSHSSRSQSPLPSETATYAANALRKAYSSLELFTTPDAHPADTTTALDHATEEDQDEEQEFEFRLFSNPKTPDRSTRRDANKKPRDTNHPAIQKLKIRVRSPSPTDVAEEGGFTVPFRGWEYYFSEPELVMRVLSRGTKRHPLLNVKSKDPNKQRIKQQFLEAAVTSGDILAASRPENWPGCHLPWRITHLKLPSSSTVKPLSHQSTITSLTTATIPCKSKKKKPGKKRRIVLRKRAAARIAADEVGKEKRTRRNREKKIKRRQKEREKKAATQTTERENRTDAGESEVTNKKV